MHPTEGCGLADSVTALRQKQALSQIGAVS
jgi:hypothetical protein